MTGTARDETARLAAVRRYQVLDTPPDGAFDRITALAARLFKVPAAIVSVVDRDRIWFKSHHGLEVDEIGREEGLCASAILHDGPWIINDGPTDPRALANSLVAGDFGLRFYAGIPLRTRDGHNLGTLCVLDFVPRELAPDEIATLEDLAALVMSELELRLETLRVVRALRERSSRENRRLTLMTVTDPLTGIANRRAMTEGLGLALAESLATERPISLVVSDLDHFKSINDEYGHPVGDRVLETIAGLLREHSRSGDLVVRFGGEEFVIVLADSSLDAAAAWSERVRMRMQSLRVGQMGRPVTASFGVATHDGVESADDLIARADEAMYRAKRAGRDRVERAA